MFYLWEQFYLKLGQKRTHNESNEFVHIKSDTGWDGGKFWNLLHFCSTGRFNPHLALAGHLGGNWLGSSIRKVLQVSLLSHNWNSGLRDSGLSFLENRKGSPVNLRRILIASFWSTLLLPWALCPITYSLTFCL